MIAIFPLLNKLSISVYLHAISNVYTQCILYMVFIVFVMYIDPD